MVFQPVPFPNRLRVIRKVAYTFPPLTPEIHPLAIYFAYSFRDPLSRPDFFPSSIISYFSLYLPNARGIDDPDSVLFQPISPVLPPNHPGNFGLMMMMSAFLSVAGLSTLE